MFTIGTFAGGFLIVLIISMISEKLLFQRIFDDPVKGKLASVAAAWLTCSVIAGFGFADSGPFAWQVFPIYLVPALAVGLLAWRRGVAIRRESAVPDVRMFE